MNIDSTPPRSFNNPSTAFNYSPLFLRRRLTFAATACQARAEKELGGRFWNSRPGDCQSGRQISRIHSKVERLQRILARESLPFLPASEGVPNSYEAGGS